MEYASTSALLRGLGSELTSLAHSALTLDDMDVRMGRCAEHAARLIQDAALAGHPALQRLSPFAKCSSLSSFWKMIALPFIRERLRSHHTADTGSWDFPKIVKVGKWEISGTEKTRPIRDEFQILPLGEKREWRAWQARDWASSCSAFALLLETPASCRHSGRSQGRPALSDKERVERVKEYANFKATGLTPREYVRTRGFPGKSEKRAIAYLDACRKQWEKTQLGIK